MAGKVSCPAIIDAAHARGIPVSAHATRIGDYRLAVEGGVDDIAHSCNDTLDDDLLVLMLRQNIVLVPTLCVQGGNVCAAGKSATVHRRRRPDCPLAPGKLADILVVRGDPLRNLKALGDVLLVVREGVIIRQER